METAAEKLQFVEKKKQQFLAGGGPAEIEKQHSQGKLTARERIALLFDPGSFHEIDMLLSGSGFSLGAETTPKPGDGVVTGFGEIDQRPVYVWAMDATVMGGSLGTVGAKKITESIEKATQARVPIIAMIDSTGERIGDFLENPRFFSLESITHSQVTASGVVPLINMIMGPCPGGLALFASIADVVFMTRNTSYMHLADPPEGSSGNDVGSAWMHARKTGNVDVLADNDPDCIKKCRELLSYLPQSNEQKPPFVDTGDDPNRREEELLTIVPVDTAKPFDMYRVISLIADNGQFFELKRQWSANLIVGFSRFGGFVVGVIANNPRDKGGCMNLDASDKMARHVRFCDAYNIPILWLADCPAYLPAIDEETRGLIRHGCRTIFSNSTSTVPQIEVIVRKLYGGGGLALPGTRLGGDLYVAWPQIERGLMGPEGAVAIIYGKELATIKDEAQKAEKRKQRIKDIADRLEELQLEACQDIIDPRDTRPFIIAGLKMLVNKKRELPRRKHSNIRL